VALLGKFQGNLALAVAAHAVQQKLAAMIPAAGAMAEERVQPLQNVLPTLKESRHGRAMVDWGSIATVRRRCHTAVVLACGFRLATAGIGTTQHQPDIPLLAQTQPLNVSFCLIAHFFALVFSNSLMYGGP
jgi:hypothetical protein